MRDRSTLNDVTNRTHRSRPPLHARVLTSLFSVQLPINGHRLDSHQKTLSGTEGDYCYATLSTLLLLLLHSREYYAHICRKLCCDNDTPLQSRVVKFGMRGPLVSPPCAEMSQIQINETDPPSAMREWILAHSLPESLEPLLIGAGIVFPD